MDPRVRVSRPWEGSHLVVGLTLKLPAAGLRRATSPLLEEERRTGGEALVSEVADPLLVHRARIVSVLTSSDHPVNAREVEVGQRAKQGLSADEANGGADLAKMIHAERILLALDGNAHPEVHRPVEPRRDRGEPLRSLGQHLIGALWHVGDDVEHATDVVDGHVLVKQVAHRVHEDQPGRCPGPRDVEGIRVNRQSEAGPARPGITVALVLGRPHRLEPLRQRERIAMAQPGDVLSQPVVGFHVASVHSIAL